MQKNIFSHRATANFNNILVLAGILPILYVSRMFVF